MADIVFLAVLVAFFAIAVLFVAACDRIIGSDEEAFAGPDTVEPSAADQERAAA